MRVCVLNCSVDASDLIETLTGVFRSGELIEEFFGGAAFYNHFPVLSNFIFCNGVV